MTQADHGNWDRLVDAYGEQYDPRSAVQALELPSKRSAAWEELWTRLHHQGSVHLASYAAVPLLVDTCERLAITDWNLYAMIATINECRHEAPNPEMPSWLSATYKAALDKLFQLALKQIVSVEDALVVRTILGFIASHKKLGIYSRALNEFAEDELEELLGCEDDDGDGDDE